jgi:hypothetical protein
MSIHYAKSFPVGVRDMIAEYALSHIYARIFSKSLRTLDGLTLDSRAEFRKFRTLQTNIRKHQYDECLYNECGQLYLVALKYRIGTKPANMQICSRCGQERTPSNGYENETWNETWGNADRDENMQNEVVNSKESLLSMFSE